MNPCIDLTKRRQLAKDLDSGPIWTRSISSVLDAIEDEIFSIYGLDQHPSVIDFKMDDAQVAACQVSCAMPISSRGNVLILQDKQEEDIHLGFHLAREVELQLARFHLSRQVDVQALNAICVAIEEVSHFHLVVNRLTNSRSTSLLELEFQGEIDKVLIALRLLAEGQGLEPDRLAKVLLGAPTAGSLSGHYLLAFEMARRFFLLGRSCWSTFDSMLAEPRFYALVRDNFFAPLHEKRAFDAVHSKGIQLRTLVSA
jgi:hypothetical protein